MADQKSRGGQKQLQGNKQRDVRAEGTGGSTGRGRNMREDAQKGQQGNAGGYHGQHGSNRKR